MYYRSTSAALILSIGILLSATRPAAPASPADEAIEDAITLLKRRWGQTEDKEEQKRILEAISSLAGLLQKSKVGPGTGTKKSVDLAKLTGLAISSRFGGHVVYNARTGELTFTYDFKDRGQLRDFDLGKSKPVLKGGLALEGGDVATHVVKFKTFSLSATVYVKQMRGSLVRTTEGTAISVGGALPDTVYFDIKGESSLSVIIPGAERSGDVPIQLTIQEDRQAFQYGPTSKLSKKVKEPRAGQIELLGGDLGFRYSKLVISGKPDEAWVAEFFNK